MSANLELFDAFRRSGELTLRIYSGLRVTQPLTDGAVQALDGIRKLYADDPLFKAGALSLRIDGELASRTAALLEPYEDASERGSTFFDADDLNRTARLADAAGWQIVAHATGDRAVRMALTAFAHAVRSNRSPIRERRHRIESCRPGGRRGSPAIRAAGRRGVDGPGARPANAGAHGAALTSSRRRAVRRAVSLQDDDRGNPRDLRQRLARQTDEPARGAARRGDADHSRGHA